MVEQMEMINRLAGEIPSRRSVRTFSGEPVAEELLDDIMGFARELSVPFEHNTRFEMFTTEPGSKVYATGLNPPTNIAMLAQTDLVSVSKAGFVGELVMLYATSLGLSTCWFGHYKLAEVGKYIPGIGGTDRVRESTMGFGYGAHVDVGERAICCMPIGYRDAGEKPSAGSDETTPGSDRKSADPGAANTDADRKPVEELLEDPGIAREIPEDIAHALEFARLAPSVGNSQMWRFGFEDDFGTITVAKPVGYEHFKWEHPDVDVGMCAAHLWLGLIQNGHDPHVEAVVDADRVKWLFVL